MEPDKEEGEFHDVGDDIHSGSETDTADEAEFADALDDILIQSGIEPISRKTNSECKSDASAENRTHDQQPASGDNINRVEQELDALKLEIENLNSNTDSSSFLSKGEEQSTEASDVPLTASQPLADRLNQEPNESSSKFEHLADDESDSETEEKDEKEIIVDAEALRQRELRESKLSEEELNQLKEQSQQLKTQGNDHFKAGEHDEAVTCYTNALDLCPLRNAKERSIMYSNRAACRLHQEKHDTAIEDCSKALELNPMYMKALLRRAELYEKTEKLDEALTDYQKALEMDPSLHAAREACMRLPDKINERNEKMKEEMMGKLKDLGNMVLRPFGLSTNNFQFTQDPNTGGYSVNFQQNAPPPPAPSASS